MGCWNKTCGLSNLHITAGKEVYVFAIERNPHLDDRCYSTSFYRPLLLPFYSHYNDYGGGENSSGIGLEPILDGIRRNLIEVEVGENKSHDIAVKRDKFNEELFFDAVHENRLKVKTFNGSTELDFVMFRKDVVDDILDNWTRQKYVGDGSGTTGWGNNYIEYKFADILADLPEFMDKLASMMNQSSEEGSVVDALMPNWRLKTFGGLETVFPWGHANKVSWYIEREGYRYSHIVNVHELIIEAMEAGNVARATALMIEHLKAVYIDSFMHEVRKVWMPVAHEGSQAQEHAGYRALIGAMSRALDVECEERKEWEEDEYDE